MAPTLWEPASPAPGYTAPAFLTGALGAPPPPPSPPASEACGKGAALRDGSSTSAGSSSPTPTTGSGDESAAVAEEVATAALREEAVAAAYSGEPLKIALGGLAPAAASQEDCGLQRAADLELPVKLLKGADDTPTAHAGPAAPPPASPQGAGDGLSPMKMLRLEMAIGSSPGAEREQCSIAALTDAWTPLMQQWGAWSGPVAQATSDGAFFEQAFPDFFPEAWPPPAGFEAEGVEAPPGLGLEVPPLPGFEALAPQAEASPLRGSALHAVRQCKPCAWFWKPGGCQNADDCSYCHLCPEGELKARKKAKAVMSRLAGGGAGKSPPGDAERGSAGNVLRLSLMI